ncbi:MAG: branched-chain amino acid transport system substrate-binding protein [Acidimicrobiaceae bacterium]|nr:branched-chain amino acid transport system substrate-binding protein [Acidimicrobiaceae bacterium]
MRITKVQSIAALAASVALVAAACGSSKKTGAGATTTAAPATTAAATTTAAGATTTAKAGAATTAAGVPNKNKGALQGFKGTTPLVQLSDAFKTKLKAKDPSLKDFNYAAETYDAVVIIALAADMAKSDGIDLAKQINGITRDGTKCTDYASCKKLADAGTNLDYDGVSGPIEFSGNGEPLQASYGILSFGADDHIDDSKTVYKQAKAPASADVAQVPVEGSRKGDGQLKIGTILPQTGSLAFLGPPEFAGFNLAIDDINAAGGAIGKPVLGDIGDSGDATTDTVNQTTDRLLGENVDAIIGAASSGVSLKVIDKITGAGVVQFSPANTSKVLSTYADKGLYFRTAPSDILQGAVLGEVIAEDGHKNIAIFARQDAYGTGLQEDLTKALTDAGSKVVIAKVYPETADTFTTEVNDVKAANPDAIVLISFDEASKILNTMVEAGIGPKNVAVYGVDGDTGNALGDNFDQSK